MNPRVSSVDRLFDVTGAMVRATNLNEAFIHAGWAENLVVRAADHVSADHDAFRVLYVAANQIDTFRGHLNGLEFGRW